MIKRLLMVAMFALVAFTIAACSTTSPTLIAPDAYVAQFAETDTAHLLIDVRTPTEYLSGHIAGSINIPVDEIASRLDEIPTDMPLVVYCQSGNRSARAATILSQNDYSEVFDLGGITQWINSGYPVQ